MQSHGWIQTGNLYCVFFPYTPEHLARSMPKSKDIRRHISLSINVSLRETDHVLGSASALFIGGFSIPEMRRGFMQLNLTPDSNRTTITILGNTDIDIYWQKKDAISINLIDKEDFGVGGIAILCASFLEFVKVFGPDTVKDRVRVSHPANGQEMVIDVNYEPAAKPVAISFLFQILILAFLALLTIWATITVFWKITAPLPLPSPSPSVYCPALVLALRIAAVHLDFQNVRQERLSLT